jgi:hypothetical protein
MIGLGAAALSKDCADWPPECTDQRAVLKITNCATAHEERWVLSGRLAGPWVAELRSSWDQVCGQSRGRRHVIDLSDVTLIDERGERLLGELKDQGAEFVARGVYTRHLLENLRTNKEERSRLQLTDDGRAITRSSAPKS